MRACAKLVGKELESLRVAGGIGAGLDAEVELYCGRELMSLAAPRPMSCVSSSLPRRRACTRRGRPDEAVQFTLPYGDECLGCGRRHPPMPSAYAAGITAQMWAAMPIIRNCADAVSENRSPALRFEQPGTFA